MLLKSHLCEYYRDHHSHVIIITATSAERLQREAQSSWCIVRSFTELLLYAYHRLPKRILLHTRVALYNKTVLRTSTTSRHYKLSVRAVNHILSVRLYISINLIIVIFISVCSFLQTCIYILHLIL